MAESHTVPSRAIDRRGGKRKRLARPYPMYTLEVALSVARAIQESNAGLPFARADLAGALGTTPTSSGYTMRLTASAKYGLTQGGYNDDRISLTPLGQSIVAPREQAEARLSLIEAAVTPDLFARFYRMLEGRRMPEDTYLRNTLQRELGVVSDLADECLEMVKANGLYAGVIQRDGDALRVAVEDGRVLAGAQTIASERGPGPTTEEAVPGNATAARADTGRVFIGCGERSEAVELVRQVLSEFDIPHVVAEWEDGDGRPVPEDVAERMRDCSSGIVVFPEASQPSRTTLFQIGAASVLYGERVVAVREAGAADAAFDLGAVPLVHFDAGSPQRLGLDLLRTLRRLGTIKVLT